MQKSYFLKFQRMEIENSSLLEVSPVGNGPHKSTATDNHGDSGIETGITGAGWLRSNVISLE